MKKNLFFVLVAVLLFLVVVRYLECPCKIELPGGFKLEPLPTKVKEVKNTAQINHLGGTTSVTIEDGGFLNCILLVTAIQRFHKNTPNSTA